MKKSYGRKTDFWPKKGENGQKLTFSGGLGTDFLFLAKMYLKWPQKQISAKNDQKWAKNAPIFAYFSHF